MFETTTYNTQCDEIVWCCRLMSAKDKKKKNVVRAFILKNMNLEEEVGLRVVSSTSFVTITTIL